MLLYVSVAGGGLCPLGEGCIQQGMRAAGIGIQLTGEEGDKARRKIETFLAGALQSDKPTITM